MKTIFRVSVLGLVMAAFMAVSAVSGFAQNPCDDTVEVKQVSYGKFREGRKEPRTIDKAKTGITGGEEFLRKYETCVDDKQVVDFVKDKLPELKDWVKKQELYACFNNSIKDPKNLNADEAYRCGREINTANPSLAFDVGVSLAGVGFDNSAKNPPVDKFNNDAINYAKTAIRELESGKTSENYGFFGYSLAVKDAQGKIDHAKSKQNVLGWMNFIIGSIMYYNQQAKKEAIPYFYQATKFESTTKTRPSPYHAIGAVYLDEILRINTEREEKIKANNNQDNEETLALFALVKGYADRAIDAYARAYKLATAKDSKTTQEYNKSLYEKLQTLYKIRFDKTDGIDAYVATVMSKPMPNPADAVVPIKDETPATTPTTTTGGTTSTTTTPGTTTPSTTTKPATDTTKPATTTTPATDTTKPTTTPTKPVSTTKPKASTSTKTSIKKKGTR